MTFLYDGTYEGLLSAVFEAYRLKAAPDRIIPEEKWQETLFDHPLRVCTREEWADRVKKGVADRSTGKALRLLYHCFLSEQPDVEMLIYRFIRLAMESDRSILDNYREETVLRLHKIDKQVGREVHRMHAFVRFQRSRDNIYFAVIEPDFNVLPLIGDHFRKRYASQEWLIYDARRYYGLYYDLNGTRFIALDGEDHQRLKKLQLEGSLDEEELDYQQLWKDYFRSVNIPERRNVKLHLQHVPRRYWKYLVEKGG